MKKEHELLKHKEEIYQLIMELGSLLADYNHQWTNEQRENFEKVTSYFYY